jgi:hypothetical protein
MATMQYEQVDEPLPPLDQPGVAPFWRILAVLSLIAVAILVTMVAVLYVAFAQQASGFVNNQWAVAPPVAAAGAAVDVADDALDPANPPYPVKQDLRPAGTFPLPGDADQAPEQPAVVPRQEFTRVAERVAWTDADPNPPDRVLVSPNGANMAYASGDVLMAGPVGAPEVIDPNAAGLPGGVVMRGGRRMAVPAMGGPGAALRPHVNGTRAVVCGWPGDNIVFWVSAGGTPRQYDLQQCAATTRAAEHTEAALPLPDGRLLAVSRHAQGKVEGAGPAASDLTSVNILPPPGGDQRATVLVPAGPSRWHSPVLAPDGKHLAIVSDRDGKPGEWRVFVLSLEGNPKPEAVSPPASRVEGVGWAPDGKALVYARSLTAPPADHAPGMAKDACDLFLLDLETKKETRLSRGGGFTSPSVTRDGTLFFLARAGQPQLSLVEMKLQAARDFAAGQEKLEQDRTRTWKDLAGAVWKEAGVPADPDKSLSPESCKKIAETFARTYADRFKADPAATSAALERQRREVAALDLTPQEQQRFLLLLGAVEGEYLCGREKGSAWHLAPGALDRAVTGENAFGIAFNPFRALRAGEGSKKEAPQALAEVLYRAMGRPVVLTNDPAGAKEALDKLVDPDLARGSGLLNEGKGDEADRVLLAMVKRHPDNHYLVVHVGLLLQQRGHTKALVTLLKPLLDQLDVQGVAALPKEARLFNLLGLALLGADANEGNANKAVTAFQDALRCDLKYGPAYVNLAGAYERLQRKMDARLCLRRYLKLFAEGEWAGDARGRLAVMGDE